MYIIYVDREPPPLLIMPKRKLVGGRHYTKQWGPKAVNKKQLPIYSWRFKAVGARFDSIYNDPSCNHLSNMSHETKKKFLLSVILLVFHRDPLMVYEIIPAKLGRKCPSPKQIQKNPGPPKGPESVRDVRLLLEDSDLFRDADNLSQITQPVKTRKTRVGVSTKTMDPKCESFFGTKKLF